MSSTPHSAEYQEYAATLSQFDEHAYSENGYYEDYEGGGTTTALGGDSTTTADSCDYVEAKLLQWIQQHGSAELRAACPQVPKPLTLNPKP